MIRRTLRSLWADDAGAIVSTELALVLGLTVFGVAPGLVALRDADLFGLRQLAASGPACVPDPVAVRQQIAYPGPGLPSAAYPAVQQSQSVTVVTYPPPAADQLPAP